VSVWCSLVCLPDKNYNKAARKDNIVKFGVFTARIDPIWIGRIRDGDSGLFVDVKFRSFHRYSEYALRYRLNAHSADIRGRVISATKVYNAGIVVRILALLASLYAAPWNYKCDSKISCLSAYA